MIIPDLKEFPTAQHPSPYEVPLPIWRDGKLGYGLLHAGDILRAVGWLGSQVPSSGDTPGECIDRLWLAYEDELLLSDGLKGWHDCEICTGDDQHYPAGGVGPIIHWRGRDLRLYGHGHYLIRNRNIVYMAPALVLHYILDHRYRPPDEFVETVIVGSFLKPEDLVFVLEDRVMPGWGPYMWPKQRDRFLTDFGEGSR
jgi:hypothetical protein